MSKRPLSQDERALWERVKATVKPLHNVHDVPNLLNPPKISPPTVSPAAKAVKGRIPPPALVAPVAKSLPPTQHGLDGHWDRRLKRGTLTPDISIDLHGLGLTGAYHRLDGALEQAIHTGMRSILLVTGRPRGHDRATGEGRGAIRAAVKDWLAASRHAANIASVRGAHPRHGGDGALYIILKRRR